MLTISGFFFSKTCHFVVKRENTGICAVTEYTENLFGWKVLRFEVTLWHIPLGREVCDRALAPMIGPY